MKQKKISVFLGGLSGFCGNQWTTDSSLIFHEKFHSVPLTVLTPLLLPLNSHCPWHHSLCFCFWYVYLQMIKCFNRRALEIVYFDPWSQFFIWRIWVLKRKGIPILGSLSKTLVKGSYPGWTLVCTWCLSVSICGCNTTLDSSSIFSSRQRPVVKMLVSQSCLILRNPMDCSRSSVHGILHTRIVVGLSFPSLEDLSDSGTEPGSLAL